MSVIPFSEHDTAAALRESSRQLEDAQRIAHLGHYEQDLATGSMIMSDENFRILGLEIGTSISREQAVGFIHPDDAALVMRTFEEALVTGVFSLDHRIVRAGGEPRYVRAEGRVVYDDGGRPQRFFGTIQDVTERHQTEELLRAEKARVEEARRQADDVRRQLLGEVLRAREQERTTLAREIHDEVGQQVSAILFGLEILSRAKNVRESRRRAAQLRHVATDTLESLRRIAHGLHPLVLDAFGLATAIEQCAKEYSKAFGIPVEVDVVSDAATRLPKDLELALYRMCLEALTNIARHSGASAAGVALRLHDDGAELVVRDDGEGFNVDAVLGSSDPSLAFGLRGIIESASQLGGSARVESAPGKGTVVSVHIPRLLSQAYDNPSSTGSRTSTLVP